MDQFTPLKVQAHTLARELGHRLGGWTPNRDFPTVQFALCRVCKLGLTIDLAPMREWLAVAGPAQQEPCWLVVRRNLGPLSSRYRYVNRWKVFERDQGVCASCGFDTEAVRVLLLDMTSDFNPGYRTLFECLLALGFRRWHLHTFRLWEANHKRAVVEDGGRLGIENVETLCVPCHRKHSHGVVSRRAKLRRFENQVVMEWLARFRGGG